MSSKHDPILLLEPSNLLEPLSLQDRNLDPFNRQARFGHDGTAVSGAAQKRNRLISVPRRGGRWCLKSALIVAGGLACFGAGTAMPELSLFGDAQRPPPAQALAPTADTPVKPEPAKPTETKVTEAPPPASTQAAAPEMNASGASTNDVGSVAPAAAPAPSQPVVERAAPIATNAPAGGATSGPNAQPANPRQSDMERFPSAPRSKGATQRDTADQQLAGDDGSPTVTSPDATPNATPNTTPGDARPSRDSNRGSSRRRDRATDSARVANDWESSGDRSSGDRSWGDRSWGDRSWGERSWGERSSGDRESDRSSNRRRDRYDDDARDDDRRSSRRASRHGGRGLFPFFDEW